MRELKLKYVINLVSDIAARARTDEQALTQAQRAVRDALASTTREAGLLERVLLRVTSVGTRSADAHANRIARLALAYQDVRRQAEAAAGAMTKVAAVGAGVAGGAYAADRLLKAPMDYSTRLLSMANTAYSDRDKDGRIAGTRTLNAAINAAVRTGGGRRDDAAATLESLIASGALNVNSSINLLPMLMKGATGSRATAQQLGAIATTGMQTFGIKLEQVPEMLNMAMVAGQAGGIELKDMAKGLPEAMAAGKGIGLTGLEGMRRLLASMQVSLITAGTKDEAMNNVVNLLTKINSEDTAKDFAKQGIDLHTELLGSAARGGNAMDTFLGLVDKVTAGVRKDPKFRKLAATLRKEGDTGGETGTTAALRALFQGTAVGKVVQDRQALMSLVAELDNRSKTQSIIEKTRSNTGEFGTSFSVMAQGVEFHRQQAINEAQIAGERAFERMAPTLNATADRATELAREFPLLTTGVVAATGALGIFTAALGASGLIGLLTGGAGRGGVLATMGGAALRYGGGVLAAGAAGYGAGTLLYNGLIQGTGLDDTIGRGVARVGAFFGNDEAAAALATEAALARAMRPRGSFSALSLTDPGSAFPSGASSPAWAAGADLARGQLDVRVMVSDERATANALVAKPLSIVRIDTGNTNPAGYAATRP